LFCLQVSSATGVCRPRDISTHHPINEFGDKTWIDDKAWDSIIEDGALDIKYHEEGDVIQVPAGGWVGFEFNEPSMLVEIAWFTPSVGMEALMMMPHAWIDACNGSHRGRMCFPPGKTRALSPKWSAFYEGWVASNIKGANVPLRLAESSAGGALASELGLEPKHFLLPKEERIQGGNIGLAMGIARGFGAKECTSTKTNFTITGVGYKAWGKAIQWGSKMFGLSAYADDKKKTKVKRAQKKAEREVEEAANILGGMASGSGDRGGSPSENTRAKRAKRYAFTSCMLTFDV